MNTTTNRASSASVQRIAMGMIAPYGVYKNGVCVGEYGTEAEAERHYSRLRNAKPAANGAICMTGVIHA